MKPEIRSTILQGDCLDVLKTLDANSVDCIITSPPYYGLRDYGTGEWVGGDPNCPHYRTSKYSKDTATGHKSMMEQGEAVGDAIYKTVCPLCGAVRVDKQIGLEETPEGYIEKLVSVFRECKRALKDDGTLWVNIGDSYAGGAGRWGGLDDISKVQNGNKGSLTQIDNSKKWNHGNIKQKDLIGIPWMLAFALRNDGWYLRQDIIWHKPNPMPESVKDRCTKAHEYIFLLSKKPRYYFDHEEMQEDANPQSKARYNSVFNAGKQQKIFRPDGVVNNTMGLKEYTGKRNKRDVWTVSVHGVKEAHFATFPEDLIEPCILAGCPKNGVVLDPFCGSGTTGIVSVRNGRNFIGIELNSEYAEMSTMRIEKERTKGIRIDLWAKGGEMNETD